MLEMFDGVDEDVAEVEKLLGVTWHGEIRHQGASFSAYH